MDSVEKNEALEALVEIRAAFNALPPEVNKAGLTRTVEDFNGLVKSFNDTGNVINAELYRVRDAVSSLPDQDVWLEDRNTVRREFNVLPDEVNTAGATRTVSDFNGLVGSFNDAGGAIDLALRSIRNRVLQAQITPPLPPDNTPPVIQFIAPQQGEIVAPLASVVLTVDVTDADLIKLEFYRDTVLINTVVPTSGQTTMPSGLYSFTDVSPPTTQGGGRTYDAKAYDAQGGTAFRSVSVVVTSSQSVNVAAASNGATMVSSSAYTLDPANYAVNGAIDGLLNKYWASGGAPPPHSITITFAGGVDQTIAFVDLYVQAAFGIRDFSVSVGVSGTFTQVASQIDFQAGFLRISFNPPRQFSQLRLDITRTFDAYARVTEIQAWTVGAQTNIPPTVSIDSLSDGQSFAPGSNIQIIASAFDTNLRDVKFYRDGVLLHTITSSVGPFSYTDVAVPESPIPYLYLVRASDLDNAIAEDSVSVNVVTPAVVSGGNWEDRSTLPNVVYRRQWATSAEFGSVYTNPFQDHGYIESGANPGNPKFDPIEHAIRWDIPWHIRSQNVAGEYKVRYDDGTRFGPNSEHYVQWRQKVNREYLVGPWLNEFTGLPSATKTAVFYVPGGLPANPFSAQNTRNKIVVTTFNESDFLIMYGRLPTGGDGPLWQFIAQNKVVNCVYPTFVGCNLMRPDVYMTIMIRIKLGPLVNSIDALPPTGTGLPVADALGPLKAYDNTLIQMLVAFDGDTEYTLLHEFSEAMGPADANSYWDYMAEDTERSHAAMPFGGLSLEPYMTAPEEGLTPRPEGSPDASVWVKELIVRSGAYASPELAIPVPTELPLWTQNRVVNQWGVVAGAALSQFPENNVTSWNAPGRTTTQRVWVDDVVDAQNGFAFDTDRGDAYSSAQMGHATPQSDQNGNYRGEFNRDAPRWVTLRESSPWPVDQLHVWYPGAGTLPTGQGPAYFPDGRPTGRHGWFTGKMVNGLAGRVIVHPYARGVNNDDSGPNTNQAFHVERNDWYLFGKHPDGTTRPPWPMGSQDVVAPSEAKDPRTEKIWVVNNGYVLDWDERYWEAHGNGTGWTVHFGGVQQSLMFSTNTFGAAIDPNRDRMVFAGKSSGGQFLPLLTGLTGTKGTSFLNLSGNTAGMPTAAVSTYSIIVVDDINDVYWYLGAGSMWKINPDTGFTTYMGVLPQMPVANQVYQMAAFFKRWRGILYIPRFNSEPWFYPVA